MATRRGSRGAGRGSARGGVRGQAGNAPATPRGAGSQSGSLNALEDYLSRVHERLERAGGGMVFKVPDPVVVTKRLDGARVEGRLERSVACDFSGFVIWLGQARGVAGEAKMTREARRWRCGGAASCFQPGQRERLTRAAQLGALAWVMVRRYDDSSSADYLLAVTPEGVSGLKDGWETVSVLWEDLAPWRVPPGKTWVDAIQREGVGGIQKDAWEEYARLGWA